MQWIDAAFGHMGHVSPAQECLRAVLIFVWGLALVRIAGRRIFGKWAALDIVVAMVVGSSLSRALTGNAPLVGTLAATAVMVAQHWLLAHLATRYRTVAMLAEGRAVPLIDGGALVTRNLLRFGVTNNDIEGTLRAHNARMRDVQAAHLEASGTISVVKRAPK